MRSEMTFKLIEEWVEHQKEIFSSGDRRIFIHHIIEGACRLGVDKDTTRTEVKSRYLSKDSEFFVDEVMAMADRVYDNKVFGTAEFKSKNLVDKATGKPVEIELDNGKVADVIYGQDVYADAEKIYDHGYVSVSESGVPEVDKIFKFKRGELTVLTGIGNMGKTAFLKFMMVNKSVKEGTKWAIFGPEDFPSHEFYHDLVEILVGADCTPTNLFRPDKIKYAQAYKWIQEHFFYVYPKDLSPTPDYIKSRFLQLVLKEKIDGCVIDPFNQMENDYQASGGRDDKYLATVLSDFTRFAIGSNIYFIIVAHPKMLKKNDKKGFDCPDVFDLAGGAMWNNKADNILVFHRPNANDSKDYTCELHTKKIRRQKIVGYRGSIEFKYVRDTRRYDFESYSLQYFFIDKEEGNPEIKKLNEPKEYVKTGSYGNDDDPF